MSSVGGGNYAPKGESAPPQSNASPVADGGVQQGGKIKGSGQVEKKSNVVFADEIQASEHLKGGGDSPNSDSTLNSAVPTLGGPGHIPSNPEDQSWFDGVNTDAVTILMEAITDAMKVMSEMRTVMTKQINLDNLQSRKDAHEAYDTTVRAVNANLAKVEAATALQITAGAVMMFGGVMQAGSYMKASSDAAESETALSEAQMAKNTQTIASKTTAATDKAEEDLILEKGGSKAIEDQQAAVKTKFKNQNLSDEEMEADQTYQTEMKDASKLSPTERARIKGEIETADPDAIKNARATAAEGDFSVTAADRAKWTQSPQEQEDARVVEGTWRKNSSREQIITSLTQALNQFSTAIADQLRAEGQAIQTIGQAQADLDKNGSQGYEQAASSLQDTLKNERDSKYGFVDGLMQSMQKVNAAMSQFLGV